MLLAGTNAAAEDVPKKKRSALEKSFMVVCIVQYHMAQFVSRTSRTRKSDVMVTLQIMKKATENII